MTTATTLLIQNEQNKTHAEKPTLCKHENPSLYIVPFVGEGGAFFCLDECF